MSYYIFLGCRKRQGKDVFADYLFSGLSSFGYTTIKESCVGYARKFVEELLPEFNRHIEKDSNLPIYNNRSYRDTVISVIDSILKCDSLAFSKYLISSSSNDKKTIYIIPDCRRLSEVDYYKSVIGNRSMFINVIRPNIIIDNNAYGEGDLDNYRWDHVIMNDGTMLDLEKKANDIINIIDVRVKSF